MADNKPKVSVLMSAMNAQAYIKKSAESILDQTYGDIELIIIDDGSTDNTWEVICELVEMDPRVVPIRNPENLGASSALNKGLSLAKGEYITRQDADDISAPRRLETQVNFLDHHPDTDVVGTAVLLITGEGKPIKTAFTFETSEEIHDQLLDQMCLCGPTLLFRRKTTESIGFKYNERLSGSEDYDFCLRMSEVTRITNISEPLYFYRQHDEATSCKKRHIQMRHKATALMDALVRRYGPEPKEEYLRIVARDYLRAAVLGWLNNDHKFARECVDQVGFTYPELFTHVSIIENILTRYQPSQPVESRLIFIEGVFSDLLPVNPHLSKLKSRLQARFHMSKVFETTPDRITPDVYSNLREGIRKDPTWLFNRGVLSLLLKSMFRKAGLNGN